MFYFDDFFGKKVLKSSLLDGYDCFFTTREFVLTPSNRDDLIDVAYKNREFLKEKFNVKAIHTTKQTHSSNIKIIDKNIDFYDDTDALISDVENSVLLLNFADCVPIILYSKKDNVASVVHAGWRGTASEILYKTVEKMHKEMNVLPENITALIGPAIGKCCFETAEDVFFQLVKDTSKKELYEKKNDKYFIDLKLLNKYQLEKTGVQNIDMCDYCTCCVSDIFFSYRKENGITARHSAIVKIKGDN
jgi:YfiH family protein